MHIGRPEFIKIIISVVIKTKRRNIDIQALRDKLSDRDRDLQNAYNQISQVSQTRTIIDAVRPTPTPAYLTCSPYFAYNMTGYGGCCGNGGNVLC